MVYCKEIHLRTRDSNFYFTTNLLKSLETCSIDNEDLINIRTCLASQLKLEYVTIVFLFKLQIRLIINTTRLKRLPGRGWRQLGAVCYKDVSIVMRVRGLPGGLIRWASDERRLPRMSPRSVIDRRSLLRAGNRSASS